MVFSSNVIDGTRRWGSVLKAVVCLNAFADPLLLGQLYLKHHAKVFIS